MGHDHALGTQVGAKDRSHEWMAVQPLYTRTLDTKGDTGVCVGKSVRGWEGGILEDLEKSGEIEENWGLDEYKDLCKTKGD